MAVEKPSRPTLRQIMNSTAIVIVAFAVAKIVSLAQVFVIADKFGVSSAWDSFVTANSIPDLIFTLIAGGALAYAFIPIFGSFLARGDRDGAYHLAAHVINTIFLTALVFSVIAFLTAPWIIGHLVAPGFTPDQQQQAGNLMRILLIGTLIFSVSGIISGILQSHQHFLLPALAPIMYDLGILFGVLFLVQPFGVRGIAFGAVIGAALHLIIQIPGLIRYRAHWYPELGWRDPHLWRVIRLMIPRAIGLGVFSFNFIVMYNIASRLGEGSVAALNWGWRIMQIPETLIGTAMGIVIFPTLAMLSELKDVDGKRSAMAGALRFILIATIPSAIGLVMIGRPMLTLLQRGEFDENAVNLVYNTLALFTFGLIVHSLLEVVARSFYADKDTITPLWAALGGAAINLIGSILLSGVLNVSATYTGDQGNVAGLALANSLGVTFEVVTLLILLRRRWGGIEEATIGRALVKTVVASLAMGVVIAIINFGWTKAGLADRGFLWTVIQLGVEVGVGGLVFVGVAFLLRMEELQTIIGLVLRRRQLAEVPA
ncbi:MAG TPA: murein biosynthesis integral membrane protein MurJ [Phototrophicaceae bacterium]|nr:murein biosynthesis integral membrane protein MurJ [Phototrophicaceae bacterium]